MTHGPSEKKWTAAGIWGNTDLPGLTAASSCNKASVQSAVKYMQAKAMESGDDNEGDLLFMNTDNQQS